MNDQQRVRLIMLAVAGVLLGGGTYGWIWYNNQKQQEADITEQVAMPHVRVAKPAVAITPAATTATTVPIADSAKPAAGNPDTSGKIATVAATTTTTAPDGTASAPVKPAQANPTATTTPAVAVTPSAAPTPPSQTPGGVKSPPSTAVATSPAKPLNPVTAAPAPASQNSLASTNSAMTGAFQTAANTHPPANMNVRAGNASNQLIAARPGTSTAAPTRVPTPAAVQTPPRPAPIAHAPAQTAQPPAPIAHSAAAAPAPAAATAAPTAAPAPSTAAALAAPGVVPATTFEAAEKEAHKEAGRNDPTQQISAYLPFPRVAFKPADKEDKATVPPPPPDGKAVPAAPSNSKSKPVVAHKVKDQLVPPPPPTALSPNGDLMGLDIAQLPPPPSKPTIGDKMNVLAVMDDHAVIAFPTSIRLKNKWPRTITLATGEQFDSIKVVQITPDGVTIEEDGERSLRPLATVK
jgi:hypothetical protein